jgi:hypothetical protein
MLIIASIFVLAANLYAATKAFVVTDEAGDNEHLVKARDNTDAPMGWYVQKCVSGTSASPDTGDAGAMPWTNEVATSGSAYGNFLASVSCQEYQIDTCKMGDDDSGTGISVKDGSVSGDIGSSDTSRRGWLRSFSATTIRGAAYYGDTPGADAGRTLNNTTWVYEWSADPTINTINPAYNGLKIDYAVSLGTTITGHINTVSGGANNVLADNAVAVYYTNAAGAWAALGAFTCVNGNFSGTYPGGTLCMVGMPGDPAALPNSSGPVSLGYQGPISVPPPVPEPALAFAGLFALALLRKVR